MIPKWILYTKSLNPGCHFAVNWMNNNGIPFEERSIMLITREETQKLVKIAPNGAHDIVYPDEFSFSLMNPQKGKYKQYLRDFHNNDIPQSEYVDFLVDNPCLIITPLITNFEDLIVGYDLERLVSCFRTVKVREME